MADVQPAQLGQRGLRHRRIGGDEREHHLVNGPALVLAQQHRHASIFPGEQEHAELDAPERRRLADARHVSPGEPRAVTRGSEGRLRYTARP